VLTNSNKPKHLQRHRWLREGGTSSRPVCARTSGWRHGEEGPVGDGSVGRKHQSAAAWLGARPDAQFWEADEDSGKLRRRRSEARGLEIEMVWMVFPIPISSARLVMGADDAP
jgi:hypothetical protein